MTRVFPSHGLRKVIDGRIRVATLNIQHSQPAEVPSATRLFQPLAVTEPGRESVSALAEHLRPLDLDVLCLQEVDGEKRRSGKIQQAKALGEKLGMTAFFTPTHMGYGLAILTRLPVKRWRVLELPRPKSPIHYDPKSSRGFQGWFFRISEPRACAYAVIEIDGHRPLIVASAHLDVINDVARRQLQVAAGGFARIEENFGISDAAWLLAGDFNLSPAAVDETLGRREATSSNLRVPPPYVDRFEPLITAKTYPNWEPRVQVDHLLGTDLDVVDSEVIHLPISDHAGLLATVELPRSS